jgi:hypothetical protein
MTFYSGYTHIISSLYKKKEISNLEYQSKHTCRYQGYFLYTVYFILDLNTL